MQKEFELHLSTLELGSTTNHGYFKFLVDHDTSGPNDIFVNAESTPLGPNVRFGLMRHVVKAIWFMLAICLCLMPVANLSPIQLVDVEGISIPEELAVVGKMHRMNFEPVLCRGSHGDWNLSQLNKSCMIETPENILGLGNCVVSSVLTAKAERNGETTRGSLLTKGYTQTQSAHGLTDHSSWSSIEGIFHTKSLISKMSEVKQNKKLNKKMKNKVKQEVKEEVAAIVNKKQKTKKQSPSNSLLDRFLASSVNPMAVAPPLLGYNCFGDSSDGSLWFRRYGAVGNTNDTCFAVIIDPASGVNVTSGGTYPGVGNMPFSSILTGNGGQNLNIADTWYRDVPTNGTNFLLRADSYRALTACVRCCVRYPMTMMPGKLFAMPVFDSHDGLAIQTFNGLSNLYNDKEVTVDGSGVAEAQCNWKASSGVDFKLIPTAGFSSGSSDSPNAETSTAKMLVIGVGWPPYNSSTNPWCIDIDVFVHCQCVAGVNGNSGTDGTADAEILNIPIETLSRLVHRLPAVLCKADIIRTDTLYSMARKSHQLNVRNASLVGRRSQKSNSNTSIQEVAQADALATGFGNTEATPSLLSRAAGAAYDVADGILVDALPNRAEQNLIAKEVGKQLSGVLRGLTIGA